jgi:hypothetical protein
MAIAQANPIKKTEVNSSIEEAPIKKEVKEIDKNNLKYMRDKDREMVRGKFIFHEVPGGGMEFNYKAYKGDQIEKYEMVDGQIYTIPLGVAKHLNQNLWYPVHAHATDENGKPSTKISQKIRRCSFQSLEFVDVEEDLKPVGLIQIEKF